MSTFCKPGPATGRLTQHGGASDAEDDGLGVREHRRDLVAAGALDIHEVGVGVLDEALQLVLSLLLLGSRVQEILRELKT